MDICVDRLKGDVGLDSEWECAREVYVGGDSGRLEERMGDGAWICMDMARVGGPRAGTKSCLMRTLEGGRRDGVELCTKRGGRE